MSDSEHHSDAESPDNKTTGDPAGDGRAPDPQSDDRQSPRKGQALAWLQLVRIPTMFTAMADIFLGFLLTHKSLDPTPTFVALLGASVCIYWTGMILNDYFDRDIDSRERPSRPIPSGRIQPATALKVGVLLNIAGLALAAFAGMGSLLIAGLLTACVWSYDGALKKTPLAPVLMGSCRFFNVMLGASASATGAMWWCPQVHVAVGLGIYVCGLTWFARQEAKTSARTQLISASFVVNAGLATLFAFILYAPDNDHGMTSLYVLAVISITIVRRLVGAIAEPEPKRVQTAIRTMLLSLVMLDATLVFFATGDPVLATTVAMLMLPAFLLSRWIPMT